MHTICKGENGIGAQRNKPHIRHICQKEEYGIT